MSLHPRGGPGAGDAGTQDSRPVGVPTAKPRLWEWPRCLWLYGAVLLLLYGPTLAATVHVWLTRGSHAHGVFILPLAVALLYLNHGRLRTARSGPTAWGLLPLLAGMLLHFLGFVMRLDSLSMMALVPILAGVVLILGGPQIWRIARFPILFLLFAAPLPERLLSGPNMWIKNASTSGAVVLMKSLGFTLVQTGNRIEIPGYALEVADVCSGYKKLVALIAFATLYGYVTEAGTIRRFLLVAAAVPIATFSNILRVAGLIAVTSMGGLDALHVVHNGGEVAALALAFAMFVGVGRMLGCRVPTHLQPQG